MSGTMPPTPARELWEPPEGWTPPAKPEAQLSAEVAALEEALAELKELKARVAEQDKALAAQAELDRKLAATTNELEATKKQLAEVKATLHKTIVNKAYMGLSAGPMAAVQAVGGIAVGGVKAVVTLPFKIVAAPFKWALGGMKTTVKGVVVPAKNVEAWKIKLAEETKVGA